MSIVEQCNKLCAKMREADDEISGYFRKIDEATLCLGDSSIDNKLKYDSVVGIEYLLVRCRLKVESEHIIVKSLLSSVDTPATLRSILMKRDKYLFDVSNKLSVIRDDLSVFQRIVYYSGSGGKAF